MFFFYHYMLTSVVLSTPTLFMFNTQWTVFMIQKVKQPQENNQPNMPFLDPDEMYIKSLT